LIWAGNAYQLGKDLSPHRGDISCAFVARYGGQIAKDPFSRCSHGMRFHAREPLNEKVSKAIPTFQDEVHHCSSISQKSIHCMSMKLNTSRCQCYLSPDPYSVSLFQQGAVYGLGLSKLGKANPACVNYKSEEYDNPESEVDPLASTEGTGEAILLEGNVPQVSSWWQKFPKRWVIVLLCFAAFLLCNMDRVSVFIWYSNNLDYNILMFTMADFPIYSFLHISLGWHCKVSTISNIVLLFMQRSCYYGFSLN